MCAPSQSMLSWNKRNKANIAFGKYTKLSRKCFKTVVFATHQGTTDFIGLSGRTNPSQRLRSSARILRHGKYRDYCSRQSAKARMSHMGQKTPSPRATHTAAIGTKLPFWPIGIHGSDTLNSGPSLQELPLWETAQSIICCFTRKAEHHEQLVFIQDG